VREDIENEKEWRRFLMGEIQSIKSSQENIKAQQSDMMTTLTTLKIKIGAISTLFGALGAIVTAWVSKHLG
jgi:hypothetical protein